MTLSSRTLGTDSPLTVSTLGLGCMGMSEFYGTADEGEAVATLHRALELGVTFLDTADMYGPFTNEQLVGRAIAASQHSRDDLRIATKFGNERAPDGTRIGINGRPDYVHAACDASLARLGVDVIDLYYQHRVDKSVPIEETVGAMAELVDGRQGPPPRPVRGLGDHDPTGPRGPSDHRTAVGVLPVHPRHRGRDPADHPRAGDRPRPLLAAGTRPADRHDHRDRRCRRRRRLPAVGVLPEVPGRRAGREPRPRGRRTLPRGREGCDARSGRPGVGARPGHGRRTDPRHQAAALPGGERRRRRRRADRRRPGRTREGRAARRGRW